jgi:hypothetical protein
MSLIPMQINVELEEWKKHLFEIKEVHSVEENALKEHIRALKDELKELKLNYQVSKLHYEQMMDETRAKLKTELQEKKILQKKFSLLDLNADIAMQEEKLIRDVSLKEMKAVSILDRAAVHLQRLFRGRKDRALASDLRRKKKARKEKRKKK